MIPFKLRDKVQCLTGSFLATGVLTSLGNNYLLI
jgi:hypothetical protein